MNIEFVTIKFGTDSKAFANTPASEIASILRRLADAFEQDGSPDQAIRDSAGVFIGEIEVLKDDDNPYGSGSL